MSGARSGTWLVLAMFGFGLCLAGGLWGYLTLHTAPFRPLAAALAERYPDSAPRVDGGQPRIDRPGEATLRIVLKVDFDPGDERRSESFAEEIGLFAAKRHDLRTFQAVEVHLYQERPERELAQRMVRLQVADLLRTGTVPPKT